MSHNLQDLKQFLDSSPTSWHAAVGIGNRLAFNEFIPLDEAEKWELEVGKSYFVIRGGSICAFKIPNNTPERAIILASHSDSPGLKLKPHPEIHKDGMTFLGVEVYGGPILSSWLNRDLGLAGRISVINAQQELEEKLVFIDDAPLIIPQIAIHLEKDLNEKGLPVNRQDHLNALATINNSAGVGYLEPLIHRYIPFSALISFDLFLVPLEHSRFLGLHSEMLSSYRIDNLVSAHAATTAIALASNHQAETLVISLCADHEEIGSKTPEGAASPFLSDILERIGYCLKVDVEDQIRLKSQSLIVSIDMSHAYNPNFSAKYDPNHHVFLGKGLAIKYHAAQKYATNAPSAAYIKMIARKHQIPFQEFVNRGDISGGSTIGPDMAHSLGIAAVDIGCPQLSMHSTREVIACEDYSNLTELLTHILQEY